MAKPVILSVSGENAQPTSARMASSVAAATSRCREE